MHKTHARADLAALPRFSCHKIVRAARVTGIRRDETNGDVHTLEFGDIALEHSVTHEWARKHDPHVGGWLVVYDDGHVSFSPAKAFERGYRIVGVK